MRTVNEIKQSITDDFMKNAVAAKSYGFPIGASFDSYFSKVSIENLLFHTFATASWMLEGLFYSFLDEVEKQLNAKMPHTLTWYRDRVNEELVSLNIIEDIDNNTLEVARYVSVIEDKNVSMLNINITGEVDFEDSVLKESIPIRCQLNETTLDQIRTRLSKVKDAGVKLNIMSKLPTVYNCSVEVFYDQRFAVEEVKKACRRAVINHIQNLPIAGEYTNMAMTDTLQAVEGVKVVEIKKATYNEKNDPLTRWDIGTRFKPESGYFSIGNLDFKMKAYE